MAEPLALLQKLSPKQYGALQALWLKRGMGQLATLLERLQQASFAQVLSDFDWQQDSDLRLAMALLHEVLERTADNWQTQAEHVLQGDVDPVEAQDPQWQTLLASLGEHQVSLWSAFLVFVQDLDLWLDDDEAEPHQHLAELAIWGQNLAAAMAELSHSGSDQPAQESIAHNLAQALGRAEAQQQEREILALLPN